MKFTFSKDFQQSLYGSVLNEACDILDSFRLENRCNVKDMMKSIHFSHPILKNV